MSCSQLPLRCVNTTSANNKTPKTPTPWLAGWEMTVDPKVIERDNLVAKQLALAHYLADFNDGYVVRGKRPANLSIVAWCLLGILAIAIIRMSC